MQGHWMYVREPHKRRHWRLVAELKEDGIVESDLEESESDSEEVSSEYNTESEFDDEEDWWTEQQIFGGW